MLRIHLCQMFYNPAYYDDGCDLLEEPAPMTQTAATLGRLRDIEAISGMLVESRASYIDHIKNKILAIATWSLNRGANVILFPEYSVPVDVLPELCCLAKEHRALIVAGTHRVRLTESSRKIYQGVGLLIDDSENGRAVAPMLLPDGTVRLCSKKSKSKWESSLSIGPGEPDICSLTIGDESVCMAVAPCIDSLQMDTLGAFWVNRDTKPNVLACPSLSPTTDMFVTVGHMVFTHEALFAFANTALFGGTGFNIPEELASQISGHKDHTRGLPINYEALLELDVALSSFFIKRRSVIAEPPCEGIREFPIVYARNNQWVDKYAQLRADVIELLEGSNTEDAIEWIDAALSDQDPRFPQEIVSRVRSIRHRNIPLFSGDISSIEDCFAIALLERGIEDTSQLFARRIAESLDVATEAFRQSSETNAERILACLQDLKKAETRFGRPAAEYIAGTPAPSVEQTLDRFADTPSEAGLSSFQDRGQRLDDLRYIIAQGSERVVVITGMPGIGKTELLKTLFLKVLIDWRPLWLPVAPGSSFARVVAELGNMLGVVMDVDSLSLVTDTVFRQKVTKLFDMLFELEKRALVIDDLKNIRGSARDYHQLQSFIEKATEAKRFAGSRLFLVSSVSSPPLWVQRAGVARLHLRGLEEVYSRRVLEYQLRASGLCAGETVPDIPQALLSMIDGHPLAAKIAAEASRRRGLSALTGDTALHDVAVSLADSLLPEVALDTDERRAAYTLSVFRLPVESAIICELVEDKVIRTLAYRAIVDFDGRSYSMHPVIRNHYYAMIPRDERPRLHGTAVSYYDRIRLRERRGSDLRTDLELVHHLALAGDLRRLSELRASLYDEMFPAAKQLYAQQLYDRAFELFSALAEMRPNDPAVWAYVGRCHGRRGQWHDCDEAFKHALQIAERTKQATWWIHRDWGHIRARFGFHPDALRHLADAKKASSRIDPSCVAAEAFISWKTGDISEARDGFEHALRIDANHTYSLDTYARLLDEEGETEYADELRRRLRVAQSEMISPSAYDIDDETASGGAE